MDFSIVAYTAIGSALMAASAYWKNSQGKKPENFDWKKFGWTALVGAILGFLSVFGGVELSPELAVASGGSLSFILENVIKGFVKKNELVA